MLYHTSTPQHDSFPRTYPFHKAALMIDNDLVMQESEASTAMVLKPNFLSILASATKEIKYSLCYIKSAYLIYVLTLLIM